MKILEKCNLQRKAEEADAMGKTTLDQVPLPILYSIIWPYTEETKIYYYSKD